MKIDITPEERDLLVFSLQKRMAYIETGSVILRASDAIQCGQAALVKLLTPAQKQLIASHEQLVQRLMLAR